MIENLTGSNQLDPHQPLFASHRDNNSRLQVAHTSVMRHDGRGIKMHEDLQGRPVLLNSWLPGSTN